MTAFINSSFGQGVLLILLGVALNVAGTYFKTDYTATSALIIGYGVRHLSGDSSNGTPPKA